MSEHISKAVLKVFYRTHSIFFINIVVVNFGFVDCIDENSLQCLFPL